MGSNEDELCFGCLFDFYVLFRWFVWMLYYVNYVISWEGEQSFNTFVLQCTLLERCLGGIILTSILLAIFFIFKNNQSLFYVTC